MNKMNPEIKQKWIDSLRSGEYKQGKRALCRIDENNEKFFCCLGVLTDLYLKENNLEWEVYEEWKEKINIGFGGDVEILPIEVVKWSGINDEYGSLTKHDTSDTLIYFNDVLDYSFKEIAKIIEKKF